MKKIDFKAIGICLLISGAIIGVVYYYMNRKIPVPIAHSTRYSPEMKVSSREEAIAVGEGAWWLSESGKRARIVK
jgi:hypothetical protein